MCVFQLTSVCVETKRSVPSWYLRFRKWTMRLPGSWGLGQAEIHSSLFITIGLLAVLFFCFSINRVGFNEFRTVAITLPIVWIVSLAFRIAAQQLAIGDFAHDSQTVVGPTGNFHTDYEYLSARPMLLYSVTGQLASLGLIALGLVINAALTPTSESVNLSAELLDLRGGWESRAWATQIMWVNVFLFCLHLLPTIPFDMRATVFAVLSLRSRTAQEPKVFRRIASFDSHLAAVMFGAGILAACIEAASGHEIIGWYAAIAAAVYLFVASQWEGARAEELEEQYSPTPMRIVRRDAPQPPAVDFHLESELPPEDSFSERAAEAQDAADDFLGGFDNSNAAVPYPPDVDEILRKLHREGTDSLTLIEREALLSASREIQERRGTTS